MVLGDFNSESDPPAPAVLLDMGWADLGDGLVGTCQPRPSTRATRIDRMYASPLTSWLLQEVAMDNEADLVGGRLIFIHLQCWEVLPFCRFQHQRYIKILCPKDPDFYTPLALKRAKGQHLPELEVYKNQSPSWSCS